MSEQFLSVPSNHDLEGDKSVFSLAVLFFRFQRFLHNFQTDMSNRRENICFSFFCRTRVSDFHNINLGNAFDLPLDIYLGKRTTFLSQRLGKRKTDKKTGHLLCYKCKFKWFGSQVLHRNVENKRELICCLSVVIFHAEQLCLTF